MKNKPYHFFDDGLWGFVKKKDWIYGISFFLTMGFGVLLKK